MSTLVCTISKTPSPRGRSLGPTDQLRYGDIVIRYDRKTITTAAALKPYASGVCVQVDNGRLQIRQGVRLLKPNDVRALLMGPAPEAVLAAAEPSGALELTSEQKAGLDAFIPPAVTEEPPAPEPEPEAPAAEPEAPAAEETPPPAAEEPPAEPKADETAPETPKKKRKG